MALESVSPPLPTRLMAGLAILKHMHDLSDEVLCARWVENPYYQLFSCGRAGARIGTGRNELFRAFRPDPAMTVGNEQSQSAACRAALHRNDLKPLEERCMATKLHHVNLCSNKVPEMDRFYREVLDLAPIPGRNEQRVTNEGYSGEVAFVTDGATEVHLAAKDLSITFRTGQAINPVEKGHIAFRTDDIAAVKSRLKDRGIP